MPNRRAGPNKLAGWTFSKFDKRAGFNTRAGWNNFLKLLIGQGIIVPCERKGWHIFSQT